MSNSIPNQGLLQSSSSEHLSSSPQGCPKVGEKSQENPYLSQWTGKPIPALSHREGMGFHPCLTGNVRQNLFDQFFIHCWKCYIKIAHLKG